MAVPSYTTDLSLITIADATTGETGAALGTITWSEFTGAIAGGTPTAETDFFISGTACIAKSGFNATGTGSVGANTATAATIPTDGAVYTWIYHFAPNALATKANGGMQILIGNTPAAYRKYYVEGRDTNIYAGWKCFPINPSITPSANQGTPTATIQAFGVAANQAASVARGNVLAQDVTRYGRGTLQITNGSTADGYGTFSGAANTNDTNTTTGPIYNRWGILSLVEGTYKFQGRLLMGNTSVAVDFRDSSKNLVIQNTEFVTSGFNLFEVQNASSIVQWTNINIQKLGTVSRGNFLASANADITLDTCNFTDMGTFSFAGNTKILDSTFRRCQTVTANGCSVIGSTFDSSVSTSAITAVNPGLVSNSFFIMNTTTGGHGLEILSGATGTYTLTNINFTGYGANSTANAAIYNNSGASLTLNVIGGSTPTVRNGTGASTTLVIDPRTFSITNLIANSEVRIYNSSLTEIAGVEDVYSPGAGLNNMSITNDPDNAGNYIASYSYQYSTTIPITVVVFHKSYKDIRLTSLSLINADQNILVQQQLDRIYSNPV